MIVVKIFAVVLTICTTVHSARVMETDQGLPSEGLLDWVLEPPGTSTSSPAKCARQNSAVDIGAHAASSAAITGCWHHASHRAELLVESARSAARGATRSAVEVLAIMDECEIVS